jgi:hypothetical protein
MLLRTLVTQRLRRSNCTSSALVVPLVQEGTPAQLAVREGGLYQQMLQMAAGKGDAASLEMDSLFDQAGTKQETLRRRTA